MKSYYEMVSEAAGIAIAQTRASARRGYIRCLRLCYGPNHLGYITIALIIDGAPIPTNWVPTEHLITPDLPYEQYYYWILDHASNLPLSRNAMIK